MAPKLKTILQNSLKFLRWESGDRELLQSVSEKVIGTTLVVVIAWHLIATLFWPQIFSPKLYFITIVMIVLTIVAMRLLKNYYLLGQFIWLAGFASLIITAYDYFQQPEIVLLFIFLPIMTEVMLGLYPTLILEAGILLLAGFWNQIPFFPPLPPSYNLVIMLSTMAATVLGWGISYNLINSIEAAALHYNEAVRRLEEARKHRAEISVLLKMSTTPITN